MEESSLRNQTIYSFSYWCRMVSNLCCFHFYRTHVYNVSVTRTNYTILHNFTFQLEFRMERPISIFFFFLKNQFNWPLFGMLVGLFGRPFSSISLLLCVLCLVLLVCKSEIWLHKIYEISKAKTRHNIFCCLNSIWQQLKYYNINWNEITALKRPVLISKWPKKI